jgi:hypothetical protein
MVFLRRPTVSASSTRTGWASAVDRFARAVHRYSDRIEMIPDRPLRNDLRELGEQLDAALADVRRASQGRRTRPTGSAVAVRAILRAGTLCAHATEAALAASEASRLHRPGEVAQQLEVVGAFAAEVRDLTRSCLEPQPR